MSCGTYVPIDFGTSGLTGSLTSENITIPTTYNSKLDESTGKEIISGRYLKMIVLKSL